MYSFIDTHTHLYTEDFADDADEVVLRAVNAGAAHLLLPSIDLDSFSSLMDLCRRHPGVCLPMIGMHPTEMPDCPHEALDRMEEILDENPAAFVAIGEIGIDLYWDTSRKEEQIDIFKRQLEWAVRYQLPISIHARSAHQEVVETLLPYADKIPSGVFHCFGGNADEACELLDKFPHFALGIGGVLTYKKSTLPAVLQSQVPLHRIVVETDAPYLTPHPHRGKRNEPSYIPYVVEKLAEIYETPVDEVYQMLLNTSHQMFPSLKAK
jgi:TatD DNase family protein